MTGGSFLATAGVMLILAIAMTGMGYSLAWLMESSAGYHGVMMALFMPMLLLSGAFFPIGSAHWLMKGLMTINPLTYGVAAIRYAIYGAESPATKGLPGMWVCFAVTAGFAVAMFVLGSLITMRRTARDAQ